MTHRKKRVAIYIRANGEETDDSRHEQAKQLEQYAKEHGLTIEINPQYAVKLDREELEQLALAEVCACRYYDLQDTLQETPDEDLWLIINHLVPCELCGN